MSNIIKTRRRFVSKIMNQGFSQKYIVSLTRLKFDVNYASVLSDITAIRNSLLPGGCSSARGVKLLVLKRDNFICQYCGRPDNILVVEHIVPLGQRRSSNKVHNLVCSCASCNVRKGSNVWIPKNILEITKTRLSHRYFIIDNATVDCRGKRPKKVNKVRSL